MCMTNLAFIMISIYVKPFNQDLVHSYRLWPSQIYVCQAENYGLQDFEELHLVQEFRIRSLWHVGS